MISGSSTAPSAPAGSHLHDLNRVGAAFINPALRRAAPAMRGPVNLPAPAKGDAFFLEQRPLAFRAAMISRRAGRRDDAMPGQILRRRAHGARHLTRADARQQARNHAIARRLAFRHLANKGVNRRIVCRHLSDFEQARSAHTAADAHGADDIFRAAALALDQGVADHARAGHAVRMADGNRAAIDI